MGGGGAAATPAGVTGATFGTLIRRVTVTTGAAGTIGAVGTTGATGSLTGTTGAAGATGFSTLIGRFTATTGAAGTTGTAGGVTGTTGAAGHDPLAPRIDHGHLLGRFDQGSSWRFLHRTGSTGTSPGTTGASGGSANTLVVHAGGSYAQQFRLGGGDKLDLRHVLAGAPLAHDLTNIHQFVKIVGHGANDPGRGLGTTLEVTGPSGSARIDLQGSGKLNLKDLLHHDSLLLPPH